MVGELNPVGNREFAIIDEKKQLIESISSGPYYKGGTSYEVKKFGKNKQYAHVLLYQMPCVFGRVQTIAFDTGSNQLKSTSFCVGCNRKPDMKQCFQIFTGDDFDELYKGKKEFSSKGMDKINEAKSLMKPEERFNKPTPFEQKPKFFKPETESKSNKLKIPNK